MALIQNAGKKCLKCKENKAEFRALIPLVVKDKVVEPHTYAVCEGCYKEQFFEVYDITYEEHLANKAAQRGM